MSSSSHPTEGADEVAIEWSMAFDHPRTGERCLDRGAEFLVFRDGRISEVRAYYHGGAGYMKEYGIERAWRDLRLNRIGAGTDEIMLDVIGRSYGI